LEGGYHPEIDTSDLLVGDDISRYRMLIGSGNWAVTLGRFDIHFSISTMGRYSAAPREGHMQAMLRLFGYLKHHMTRKLVIDTTMMDHSEVNFVKHNWSELYPGAKEELPPDMPEPKGKPIQITTYFDSDHAHDIQTRRSVTGALLYLNNTPVQSYSKRQNTIESSTYGSELVAGRIATDLTMAMRYKLRMLGVPLHGPAILLGDNKGMIDNCTLPSSTLKKKHNAIAYHRVREAVAADAIMMGHVDSKSNRADPMTKSLGPINHYPHMSSYLR
jgi:hypothetical protein